MSNPNENSQNAQVDGSQQATPDTNANVKPAGIDVNELAKKIEDMEKRLSDKDRYINELSSEKETLAYRLSQVNSGNENTPAPAAAAPVFDANAISELIDRQTYINKVKEANADLIEVGLEPQITQDADRYIRQNRMSFKEAIDKAVRERRELLDKKYKTSQPVPSGARAETPANTTPIVPPPPKEKDIEDEGDARYARRMRLGL